MKRTILAAGALAALALAGCSTVQATRTAPDVPAPMTDAEINALAAELAWADMTAQERDDICWAWSFLGPSEVRATFGDDDLYDAVEPVFEREC